MPRAATRRSTVQNRLQSKFTPIHLCGFVLYESTRSSPALTHRNSGTRAAMPAIAASTCSHTCSRSQIAPTSGVGSNAIDEVVPWVVHTKNGSRPASRSAAIIASRAPGCIAKFASCGTMRMRSVPIPAMRRPFSMPECAWAVAYATSREVSPSVLTAPSVARQRAARIATSTASLAEPWITPPPCSLVERNRSGRSSSSIIQSSISVSSSVHAGEVTQLMPCTPSPADSSSPRIDEYDVFAGK